MNSWMNSHDVWVLLFVLLGVHVTPTFSSPHTIVPATLHLLDSDNLHCLDGTPAAYYYRPATSGSNRWVFSLEGGGECTSDDDCTDRANSKLGSSKTYVNTTTDLTGPFYSTSAEANPDFHDAHHVVVKYCSGDLYSGGSNSAHEKNGLWFQGGLIARGVVFDLKRLYPSIDSASIIVWSGQSAGGIGSLFHLDYISTLFPDSAVIGAPVAGFYWPTYKTYVGEGSIDVPYPFDSPSLKIFGDYWKVEGILPPDCVAQSGEDCLLADVSVGTIKSRVFFIESQTDSVQLSLHNGVGSEDGSDDQNDYVAEWSLNMTAKIKALKTRGSVGGQFGAFNPSCYIHTDFNSQTPLIGSNKTNFYDAFHKFVFNDSRDDSSFFVIDDLVCERGYDCNDSC